MNQQQTVVIIGGSSGMGFAAAELAAKENFKVIIASRSHEKLLAAQKKISSENVSVLDVDMTDENSVSAFTRAVGNIDHLVISGSEITIGDMHSLSLDQVQSSFDSKFFGPYRIIKALHKQIKSTGSITLFSGSAGQKPKAGSEILTAINLAVEGFTQSIAKSLAPIRVNCISPGVIDTPIFQGPDRQKMLDDFTKDQLIPRSGEAKEVAQSVMYLLTNEYTTGTILQIDGGQ